MADGSKGKIFLAGERGHTETGWFRSYNTFNFGGYQSEHKKPFGDLYVLNDDTLAGSKKFSLTIEEDSAITLLPVVGAVRYKDSLGNEYFVEAGQCLFCPVAKGATLTISNPYDDLLVNFLQAWFRFIPVAATAPSLFLFDMEKAKNSLVKIAGAGRDINFFMGKFDGRSESTLQSSATHSRFFAFVIQGAFEVQNRLLESRDGLALWDVNEVEFEALSNEAIILLLEMANQE